MVEELHGTVREGSDASWFGVEGYLLHLQCSQIRVIIDAALGEQGDILEAIVVLDDVTQVGVTFAANVLKGLDVEVELGRHCGVTFGVDLTLVHDGLKPGKVFIVVGDDELEALRVKIRDRGGSSG